MMYGVCINFDKTSTFVHPVRWWKQVCGLLYSKTTHLQSKKVLKCLWNLRFFILNFTLLPVLSFTKILKYTIMKSWLKGQDLQTSCHWGGKKPNKSRTMKRCSTGFHCLLLALKPLFSQAYGARVSAIILLTLPPRQILTVEPIEKESRSGLPAHGLSTEEYATRCSAVDLVSQVHGWMIKQIFDPAAFGTSSLKAG